MATGTVKYATNISTPGVPQYVQINNGGYVKFGNIVIVSVSIKVWNNFSTSQTLLNSLPRSVVENPALSVRNVATYTAVSTARISGTSLYSDSPLTNGESYIISGSYITNN